MKQLIIFILIVTISTLFVSTSYSQDNNPWGGGNGNSTIFQPSTTDPANSTPTFGSSSSSSSTTTLDDPGFPGGGTGGDTPLDNAVPIDGGLSVLLAAGIGKGLKSYRSKKKAKK